MLINVINRSTGVVCYSLPELNTHRVFNVGESKKIDSKELEALWQSEGGAPLITGSLLVEDEKWVNEHFDPSIEYWWKPDEIKDCVMNDSIDLFSETLDYAPEGVIDYIKLYSWSLPLQDLNKIQVIREKLGFDVLTAVECMKTPEVKEEAQKTQTRLRQRKGE